MYVNIYLWIFLGCYFLYIEAPSITGTLSYDTFNAELETKHTGEGPCADLRHRALHPKVSQITSHLLIVILYIYIYMPYPMMCAYKASAKMAKTEIVEVCCRHMCCLKAFGCANERYHNLVGILNAVWKESPFKFLIQDTACKVCIV